MAKSRGKVHKGFRLPEDVIAWLEKTEESTGVAQSRIVLAALCAYGNCKGEVQREVMRFAMGVERGDFELGKIRTAWIEHQRELRRRAIEERTVPAEEREEFKKQLKLLETRENWLILGGIYSTNWHEIESPDPGLED